MSNKLIEAYKGACSTRRKIRSVLLLAVLLEVAIFGGLFYSSFKNFSEVGAHAYGSAVQKKINPILASVVSDFPKIMSRIVPVYSANMERSFQKEMPVIHKLMLSELEKLEAYGSKQSPFIQAEIGKFVEAQQKALVEELTLALGSEYSPEQVDKVALDYRIALDKKFSEFMVTSVGRHLQVAEEIHTYAEQLAAKPELAKIGFDPQAILGVGLEMLGRDLQEIQ